MVTPAFPTHDLYPERKDVLMSEAGETAQILMEVLGRQIRDWYEIADCPAVSQSSVEKADSCVVLAESLFTKDFQGMTVEQFQDSLYKMLDRMPDEAADHCDSQFWLLGVMARMLTRTPGAAFGDPD